MVLQHIYLNVCFILKPSLSSWWTCVKEWVRSRRIWARSRTPTRKSPLQHPSRSGAFPRQNRRRRPLLYPSSAAKIRKPRPLRLNRSRRQSRKSDFEPFPFGKTVSSSPYRISVRLIWSIVVFEELLLHIFWPGSEMTSVGVLNNVNSWQEYSCIRTLEVWFDRLH